LSEKKDKGINKEIAKVGAQRSQRFRESVVACFDSDPGPRGGVEG
jgi:hypothetical protein